MNSNENTQPLTDDLVADAAPAAPVKGRRRRNALIGAGAAVALVMMGGGAYAFASSNGDNASDVGTHASSTGSQSADDHSDDADDHSDDGGRDDDGRHDDADDHSDDSDDDSRTSGAPRAASDEAALRNAAEAAIAHAGGEGVTSIDVERGGYDIDVRLADGTEVDLFVRTDGTIRTDDDDDDSDDDSSEPLLDLAKLGDILAAAQSAATAKAGSAGVIESISTDDESSKAYEVELRLDDRRDVEVELAGDLTVVTVDIDD
ncbi:hypothetical protein [Microbacterium sp. H1-D42]|uniref:hypothetical protein n=1 Tax=Microbacterium sp. H1-D42 TaxID=2925844 RepID=UPI001F52CC9D|nr:hypothetical protein [Microbacterium sp. H1-D42]UNK71753.1 hypothetical protein MNR00_04660 [Microbacterium sp. H1-D42]